MSSSSFFPAPVQMLLGFLKIASESDVAENIKVDQPYNTSILGLAESLI